MEKKDLLLHTFKKKMAEDKKMLVGVFMTSFRFLSLGCEGGRAEGDGTYNLCNKGEGSFPASQFLSA